MAIALRQIAQRLSLGIVKSARMGFHKLTNPPPPMQTKGNYYSLTQVLTLYLYRAPALFKRISLSRERFSPTARVNAWTRILAPKNRTLGDMKQEQTDPAARPPSRTELIRRARLNSRQVEALDLLAKFLTNKAIAHELGISLPAAKKLLHSAYLKLDVHSRSEASALWREAKP